MVLLSKKSFGAFLLALKASSSPACSMTTADSSVEEQEFLIAVNDKRNKINNEDQQEERHIEAASSSSSSSSLSTFQEQGPKEMERERATARMTRYSYSYGSGSEWLAAIHGGQQREQLQPGVRKNLHPSLSRDDDINTMKRECIPLTEQLTSPALTAPYSGTPGDEILEKPRGPSKILPDLGVLVCGFDQHCAPNPYSERGGYCKKTDKTSVQDRRRKLVAPNCNIDYGCQNEDYNVDGSSFYCSAFEACFYSSFDVINGGMLYCSKERACAYTSIDVTGGKVLCDGFQACGAASIELDGGSELICTGADIDSCFGASVNVRDSVVDNDDKTYIECSSASSCEDFSVATYTPATIICTAENSCDRTEVFARTNAKTTILCADGSYPCNEVRFFGASFPDIPDESKFCLICGSDQQCAGISASDGNGDLVPATSTIDLALNLTYYGTGCDDSDRAIFCNRFADAGNCASWSAAPPSSPSESMAPSVAPSASVAPSSVPSVSMAPSSAPSSYPSESPSDSNCATNEAFTCKFDDEGTPTHSAVCIQKTGKSGKDVKFLNECEKNEEVLYWDLGTPISNKGNTILYSCGCCDRDEVGGAVSIKDEDKDFCGGPQCTNVSEQAIANLCSSSSGKGNKRRGLRHVLGTSNKNKNRSRRRGLKKGSDFEVPVCVESGGLRTVECFDPFKVPTTSEGFVQCGECPGTD